MHAAIGTWLGEKANKLWLEIDIQEVYTICQLLAWSSTGACLFSYKVFPYISKKISHKYVCNFQQLVQSKSSLALTKSTQQQCTKIQHALQFPIWIGLHQMPSSRFRRNSTGVTPKLYDTELGPQTGLPSPTTDMAYTLSGCSIGQDVLKHGLYFNLLVVSHYHMSLSTTTALELLISFNLWLHQVWQHQSCLHHVETLHTDTP